VIDHRIAGKVYLSREKETGFLGDLMRLSAARSCGRHAAALTDLRNHSAILRDAKLNVTGSGVAMDWSRWGVQNVRMFRSTLSGLVDLSLEGRVPKPTHPREGLPGLSI
jgi:hypothetical protein